MMILSFALGFPLDSKTVYASYTDIKNTSDEAVAEATFIKSMGSLKCIL